MIKYKRLVCMLVMMLVCLTTTRAVNPFTIQDKDGQRTQIAIGRSFSETTIIQPFTVKSPISGLCITGSISKISDDYLVRVILKAADGHEYCVLESYDLIHDEATFDFSDYCEETAMLDAVMPESIKLIVTNATLSLENISLLVVSERMQHSITYAADREKLKSAQVNWTIDKINEHNRNHNKIWSAGPTRLAEMSYEEKMRVLDCPEEMSTCGYEYYYDGIFEVGNIVNSAIAFRNTPYVNSFDWRNRHGKNWITSIKDQKGSAFCFSFCAMACIEAMINLHYNCKLDLDLSDDEGARCTYSDDPYYMGGLAVDVLEYVKQNGVVDEDSYPFVDSCCLPCKRDIVIPNQVARISNYHSVNLSVDSIKASIINKGVLTSGYIGHAMALVGYKTINEGDIISIKTPYNFTHYETIGSGDPRIGQTYWIFKNSYDVGCYGTFNGYHYILFSDLQYMRQPYYVVNAFATIGYSENDIICEDADGDGYYFWGIGPKPSTCPSWIPDTPDGDDSDYDYGPMDIYGHLLDLHSLISQSVIITGNTTYSSPHYNYGITVITPNSSLTVTDQLTLYDGVYIIVSNGSTLIVDGGSINNADIILQSGGRLILSNGGIINMADGKEFSAPVGAVVEISEGTIKNS